MDYWDRIVLILLLVVNLLMVGLVIGNASVSGYAVGDLFEKGALFSGPNSMTIYTLILLFLSIVAILITYFVFTKAD